jgi:hypothetical protein
MYRQLANIAYVLALAIAKACTAVVNAWWTAMGDHSGRYRPEAHYMRGPGRSGGRNTLEFPSDGRKIANFSSGASRP